MIIFLHIEADIEVYIILLIDGTMVKKKTDYFDNSKTPKITYICLWSKYQDHVLEEKIA